MDTSEREQKPRLVLTGANGNAYNILALARKALTKAGYSEQERQRYFDEATAGDYDHLMAVTFRWFDVT